MPGVGEVGHWSVVTNGEREKGKRTYVVYDDFLYAILYGIYVQCFQRVSVLPPSKQDFLREMGRASEQGVEARTFSR